MNFLLVNGHHAMHLNLTLCSCVLGCIWQIIGKPEPRYVSILRSPTTVMLCTQHSDKKNDIKTSDTHNLIWTGQKKGHKKPRTTHNLICKPHSAWQWLVIRDQSAKSNSMSSGWAIILSLLRFFGGRDGTSDSSLEPNCLKKLHTCTSHEYFLWDWCCCWWQLRWFGA